MSSALRTGGACWRINVKEAWKSFLGTSHEFSVCELAFLCSWDFFVQADQFRFFAVFTWSAVLLIFLFPCHPFSGDAE